MQEKTTEEAARALTEKLARLRAGTSPHPAAVQHAPHQEEHAKVLPPAASVVSHVVAIAGDRPAAASGAQVDTALSLAVSPAQSAVYPESPLVSVLPLERPVLEGTPEAVPVAEKPKALFIGAMNEFINEMERFIETAVEIIDGKKVEKPANLMRKYQVTAQVAGAGYDEFNAAKKEDFVRQQAVEALNHGNVLNVGIEGFDSFRILKICSTESAKKLKDSRTGKVIRFEKLICVVELQIEGGAVGKRELLITFPLREGENILLQDPVTQKLIGKRPILSIEINTRPPSNRFLSFVAKLFGSKAAE